MSDPVPVTYSNDPDLLRATESYGPNGSRQMRIIEIGNIAFVDIRDVTWLVDTAGEVFWNWKFQYFWSQVAIVVMLSTLPAQAFSSLMYDYYEPDEEAERIVPRFSQQDEWYCWGHMGYCKGLFCTLIGINL